MSFIDRVAFCTPTLPLVTRRWNVERVICYLTCRRIRTNAILCMTRP